MSRLVFDCEEENCRMPDGCRCDCGHLIPWEGFGADYSCSRCGREYNSGGQALAPRCQWGEETGEDPGAYGRGVANPERAFDDEC